MQPTLLTTFPEPVPCPGEPSPVRAPFRATSSGPRPGEGLVSGKALEPSPEKSGKVCQGSKGGNSFLDRGRERPWERPGGRRGVALGEQQVGPRGVRYNGRRQARKDGQGLCAVPRSQASGRWHGSGEQREWRVSAARPEDRRRPERRPRPAVGRGDAARAAKPRRAPGPHRSGRIAPPRRRPRRESLAIPWVLGRPPRG